MENSDAMLVEASQHGDVQSFTRLCTRYYPALVAIGHAVLRDRHLAEDAAQESLAAACRNLRSLRKLDRFGSWIASICRNRAKDMLRGAKTIESLADRDPPARTEDADDRHEMIRSAIDALSPDATELVYLRYYDEMSYARMSAVLGVSKQAINGRLRRIRQTIRDHVARLVRMGGEQ